jgi:hypothetical protein
MAARKREEDGANEPVAATRRTTKDAMYGETMNYRTVQVPLTRHELEDSSYDTVFLVAELSDAIRRGVMYFSLNGNPLPSLNDVLNALVSDGEVAFDDDLADDPIPH